MNDCIFCQIIKKDVPSNIVYSSDRLIVFPDTSPSADVHLLIVPKKHISRMENLGKDEGDLLVGVYETVAKLVEQYNLRDEPYRVVVNGGKAQHVPHLHFHFLGGQLKKYV